MKRKTLTQYLVEQQRSSHALSAEVRLLIETVSRGITLFPGDMIATGTPAGVGMGLNPPRYIAKGDVIRVEIDGVGQIENRFV